MRWLQDRSKRCKWFNGIQNDACNAGIPYDVVRLEHEARDVRGVVKTKSLPCLSECDTCSARTLPTVEELAADDAEMEQRLDRMRQGKSPCCNADLDLSQVINAPGKRHHGHGARICTACRKVAFWV